MQREIIFIIAIIKLHELKIETTGIQLTSDK